MGESFIKFQPNYKISVLFPEENKSSCKCYSFYSERTPMAVVRFFSNITCQEFYGKKNLKIVVKHTTYTPTGRKRVKNLTYHRHLVKDFTLEEVISRLKAKVLKDSASMPTKATRFSLCIRNKISQETDTKYLTFNDKGNYEDIFAKFRRILAEIEKKEQKGMVYISDTPIESSHTIILFKSGSMKDLKKPTKSFSINIPYFSSEEIVNLIRGDKIE